MSIRWGVCSTIKAPTKDILRFVAYHLDAGAHRIWVYLDAENGGAYNALDAHPNCTVINCNEAYWYRYFGDKPAKHQTRQSRNATRTLARAGEVDWLLHIDVDEFLVSPGSVSDVLASLPETVLSARVRPMEVLASATPMNRQMAFKAFLPNGDTRLDEVRALYPTYGDYIIGGFISHLAGKIFVRTRAQDLTLRIHNALRDQKRIQDEAELEHMALAHLHAPDWETWLKNFDFRMANGAYGAKGTPVRAPDGGRITLHEFFNALIEHSGNDSLRHFFDEVCADTPMLRERLAERGLLRLHDLNLDAKVHHYFPDYRPLAATV